MLIDRETIVENGEDGQSANDEVIPERQIRYGGAQADNDEEEEARLKREERERKKAEVRKRLEEAGRAKKAKKGFLTPERKKKLRVSFSDVF
ncbi:unnamed protein product [Soboliphyme baturini]|uniref:Uncharacterized protein n=1 Tax=Soboliphyme baturini TaxID=241478 RepID=A0A183J5Z3_9BILA|nr:unnamed protein product [Soboliphyme baturini]